MKSTLYSKGSSITASKNLENALENAGYEVEAASNKFQSNMVLFQAKIVSRPFF